MRNRFTFPILIMGLLLLNGIIYIRAVLTIPEADMVFAECARNSGRTSAALNLVILFMIGHYGLKSIYKEPRKKDAFRVLISLFAINHLIHFFFFSQNFKSQMLELNINQELHGFVTYIFILLAPIVLWSIKKLNAALYFGIILHLLNVTYIIAITFYGRYKPIDPAYLHRLGTLVMIGAVIYVIYRVFRERSTKFAEINS